MEAKVNWQGRLLSGFNNSTKAKRSYMIVGIALFVMSIIYISLQDIVGGGVSGYLEAAGKSVSDIPWLRWVVAVGPLYLIAIPISMIVMKKSPARTHEKVKLGAKNFWIMVLMLQGIMTVGNVIGSILPYFITSGTAENGLLNYSMENSVYKIIVICILAPIFEEYIFRKQIIDRCSEYGEAQAIVFSGITFGLFHMNLFQFFYATGIGLILAYVYTRTRDMRYNVAMHMIVNLIGSVIAPLVISNVDMELMTQMSLGTADQTAIANGMNGIILYYGYLVLNLGMSLIGIILLVLKRKQFVIREAAQQMEKRDSLKTIYLNIGFVLFAVCCLVITVMNLF